jgi:hypothetical protein
MKNVNIFLMGTLEEKMKMEGKKTISLCYVFHVDGPA